MPLRALLWDEKLFSAAAEQFFGMDWGTWASSLEVDDGINRAIRLQAILFFGFAAAALLPLRLKFLALVHVVATLNLGFLAWLKYHDSGVGVGMFVEHASQVLMPVIVLLAASGRRWAPLALMAMATTFVGHGLFAIGIPMEITWLNHTRPGNFVEMTMLGLRFETETAAGRFLLIAGSLDLVAAGLIFIRGRASILGLCFMVFWGFTTALARPWAYYEPTAAAETLLRWVPEFIYRVPHFALPVCLLLLARQRAKVKD
ncbi:MAG: hypothetical protein P8J87_18865 [Verrucomicrobiales bacterium]|nr:hypothetical protein [Verrucomicrobiales bacterium]